jgi:hypothetical protein
MAITGWREFPAFVWGDGPLRPGIGWGELSASGGGAGRAVCGARSSTRRWRRWPGRPRTRARLARARSGQGRPTRRRATNRLAEPEPGRRRRGSMSSRVRPDVVPAQPRQSFAVKRISHRSQAHGLIVPVIRFPEPLLVFLKKLLIGLPSHQLASNSAVQASPALRRPAGPRGSRAVARRAARSGTRFRYPPLSGLPTWSRIWAELTISLFLQ